jgi:hypothetical protein
MAFVHAWHAHALGLTVQHFVPFSDSLRWLKRRLFGYAPDLSNLWSAYLGAERIMDLSKRHGLSLAGATILEIGSGWFPVIPMVLAAEGAGRVYMTDVKAHQDDSTFEATRRYLSEKWADRQPSLRELRYLAPFDPAAIPDASVDLVFSRAVLEHIREGDIAALLAQIRPKMKPGGLHVHLIDNSDHFEHRDKSISRVEFLTRTAWLHNLIWRAVGDGENRLRHSEYRRVFEAAGYDIVADEPTVCERTRAAVPQLRLQAPWRSMSPDEIAAIESIYVLRAGAHP